MLFRSLKLWLETITIACRKCWWEWKGLRVSRSRRQWRDCQAKPRRNAASCRDKLWSRETVSLRSSAISDLLRLRTQMPRNALMFRWKHPLFIRRVQARSLVYSLRPLRKSPHSLQYHVVQSNSSALPALRHRRPRRSLLYHLVQSNSWGLPAAPRLHLPCPWMRKGQVGECLRGQAQVWLPEWPQSQCLLPK